MRFIVETDCKLSVSNGSVSVLSTSKMKTIFLLTLDFTADTTRCREWLHVYSRVGWQLTLDESYCVRKLVSCITHLQSCAKVDIWNKKKKLRTVAKIKPQGYRNCRLPKFSTNVTPPLYTATTLFNEHRSQRPFGTSDWQNYSSRLAWLLSQAVTWFATDCNVQRKKSSFVKVKWSNSIKINTPVAVQ